MASSGTNEEIQWMQAARTDAREFAAIYERYFPRIYAYCAIRAGDSRDAEDLAGTVFARALASLKSYRGGSVPAWLFRIAHNVIVNYYKQRRRTAPLEDEHWRPAADPELVETIIQSETQRHLTQLIAVLPARQRDILLLKIVGGLSAEEIGTTLGLRAGAVRVTLHRTLKSLYTQMNESETDHYE